MSAAMPVSSHTIHPLMSRLGIAFAIAGLSFSSAARADLANIPLSVANSVEPNLMLVLDDSGSMDWEMLFKTDTGQLSFQVSSDSNGTLVDGSGRLRVSGNIDYSYLFPNGTGSGNKVYAYNSTNGRALPPRPELAFARSSDYNGQYYDPMMTYRPWVKADGTYYPDATPTSAISDPEVSGSERLNLTTDIYANDNNWRFYTARSMRRENGSGYPGETRETNNSGSTQRYHYTPATYYVRLNSNIALPGWLGGNCQTTSGARYETYYSSWSTARQTALEAVGVDAIAFDGGCLKKYEIPSATSFPSGRTQAAELQNFANWFSYYRKRHMTLRAGLGAAFADKNGMSVGAFTINSRSSSVDMWSMDTQKDDLYDFMYGRIGRSASTPNREGMSHAGSLFASRNAGIIKYACQQNFMLQFTDGYSNTKPDLNVDNADGNNGAPYADSYSDTLGDIAMYYYENRLRTDLDAGKVPVRAECSTSNPPAWMDCERDLHVNTYGITLGAVGDFYANPNYFSGRYQTVRDAYTYPPTWPTNVNDDSGREQVDDLYHAAVNGRGQMFNAQNSTELSQKLSEALRAILGSVISSASVVASNSTRLDANTVIYQARFDSADWSGQLLKIGVNADGSVGALAWNAGSLIPAPASRSIYTRTGAGTRVAFEWNNLDSTQQAALNAGDDGQPDGLGPQRVDYLRGDRSGEQANGGAFRDRGSVLGDIVNASPWFVGAQDFGYDQLPAGAAGRSSYRAFVNGNKSSRQGMVYVAANDGMVHGFNADSGIESYAYIPSEIVGDLNSLTDPSYRHRYYVDGTPISGDAYVGGSWKTYLVGSLGAGGKTVYAIDVTNPGALGVNSIKWEFTDPDLGYVVGRPSIARMANGSWAVIFGSGYTTGKSAKLFIVDLATGSLLKKISTVRSQDESTASANGMASPFPVDIDGDRVTDFIYSGDEYGNLWKFDVRATSANSWGSSFVQSNRPQPLFTACAGQDASGPFACPAGRRQPITMRPVVGRGETGTLMVYFGTGSFIQSGDNIVAPSDPVQSFYGIQDANTLSGNNSGDRVAGRSELTEQEILAEVGANGSDFRVVSQNPVGATKKGWYMDLESPRNGMEGERAVSQPILHDGRLIFPTLIPSSDPCEGGGTSWLMELEAQSGGSFDIPVLDVNGDGVIDGNDYVDYGGDDHSPGGRRSEVGIIDTPTIIEGSGDQADREYKYASGSTGGIEVVTEAGRRSKGRNSWRQLWPGN